MTLLSAQGDSEFTVEGISNTFSAKQLTEGTPKETANKHKKKSAANFIILV
jgi:hypothetical protein